MLQRVSTSCSVAASRRVKAASSGATPQCSENVTVSTFYVIVHLGNRTLWWWATTQTVSTEALLIPFQHPQCELWQICTFSYFIKKINHTSLQVVKDILTVCGGFERKCSLYCCWTLWLKCSSVYNSKCLCGGLPRECHVAVCLNSVNLEILHAAWLEEPQDPPMDPFSYLSQLNYSLNWFLGQRLGKQIEVPVWT